VGTLTRGPDDCISDHKKTIPTIRRKIPNTHVLGPVITVILSTSTIRKPVTIKKNPTRSEKTPIKLKIESKVIDGIFSPSL